MVIEFLVLAGLGFGALQEIIIPAVTYGADVVKSVL